jgi:hypothetical protein
MCKPEAGDPMKQRLPYLDNLKVLLVVGVIAVHARLPMASTAPGTWSRTTRWRAGSLTR